MNLRLICSLLLVWLAAGSVAWSAEPKKVALLVGVNEYQRRNFTNLRYAERDMDDLSVELKKLGFATTVLKGSGAGAAKATRDNLEKAMQKLVADTGKEDIVLVALSGHGVQMEKPPAGGVKKDDAYFCPYDATLGDAKSLLSLSYLIDDVLATKGGRNLLLVDACRDEPLKAGTRGVQGRRVDLPENTAVLFSCSAGQTSLESPRIGGGHGAFSYCVLEALRGKAVRDGEVSWADMVATVESLMESSPEIKRVLEDAPPQEPIHAGHVKRTILGKVNVPALLVVPFDARTAAARQKEWATHLGLQGTALVNSIGQKLSLIPPGEFSMGLSAADQKESHLSVKESPERPAKVTRPYLLGAHEVTQAEFEKVMGTNPSYYRATGKGKEEVAGLDTSSFPADSVAWYAAAEFCNRLSAREGLPAYYKVPAWKPDRLGHRDVEAPDDAPRAAVEKGVRPAEVLGGRGYRLPTDEEWEYACRAGATTAFSFGATSTAKDGNMSLDFSTAKDYRAPPLGRPTKVGSYAANAFGLFDMHGNLSEWVYHEDAGAKPLLRSGSYSDYLDFCRSGARSLIASGANVCIVAIHLGTEFEGIGFRVARNP